MEVHASMTTQLQAAAETQQLVTVTQSIEIVQTLLHGSVSSILFVRDLLPPEAFVDQYYAAINSHRRYSDYVSGMHDPAALAESVGHHFKSLKKGKSTRGDRIINLLEGGVFKALRGGFLDQLHLSIIEDPNQPLNVLEVHSFAFRYRNPIESHSSFDVEMTGPGGVKVTIKNARRSMGSVIRNLITSCSTMPQLPENCYVMLHLQLNGKQPADVELDDFCNSTFSAVAFPDHTNTEKATTKCGITDAGFHSVFLQITHLNVVGVDMRLEDVDQIPENLTYKSTGISLDGLVPLPATLGRSASQHPRQKSRRWKEREAKTELPTPPHFQPTPYAGGETLESNLSAVSAVHSPEVDLDLLPVVPRQISKSIEDSPSFDSIAIRCASPLINSANAVLSRREGLTTREQLDRMLPISSQPYDTQVTQGQGRLTQGFANLYTLQLSQKTIDQLDLRRSNLLPPRRTVSLTQGMSESLEEVQKIECQCGWNEPESDMIICDFCMTWQHLHCYGYRGEEDQRKPSVHACYSCLLQDKHPSELRELEGLALYRRGIHLLLGQDFETIKNFQAALGCSLDMANRIVQRLRSTKLVKSGKCVSFIKSMTNIRLITKEYFDPLSKIAHYFTLPPAPNATSQPTMGAEQGTQDHNPEDLSQTSTPNRRYPLRPRNSNLSRIVAENGEANKYSTPSKSSKKRVREGTSNNVPRSKLKTSHAMPFGNHPTP